MAAMDPDTELAMIEASMNTASLANSGNEVASDEFAQLCFFKWNFEEGMIACQDGDGRTPYHYAAQEGRADVMRWLTARGLTDLINTFDHEGWTPLWVW